MKRNIDAFKSELTRLRGSGTFKEERVITTPQRARIDTMRAAGLLNMCANNYLGLSNSPELIEAAKASYDKWGLGCASVRFICGTQEDHQRLERKVAVFVGMEDAILYGSCYDAGVGLFEALLGEEDAVISDELNHASIIDGVRLCRAKRFRYHNSDMQDLERCLKEAQGARVRLIVTDGVFSMDGTLANLPGICDLADRYDALVMVDDSHAVGVMGKTGRGTPEHFGVSGRVDILSGTFGKALGGASGGYIASAKPIVELLRQKSRPYLFSNALAPAVVAASMKAIDMLTASTELRDRLAENAAYFRAGLEGVGFDVLPGEHPIIPIMMYDARVAQDFASRMLGRGVYVVGFSHPVVPEGKARIRTQVSAAHTTADLDFALRCFVKVRADMRI
ncbi:MAG TPA: glycine C-acetyltransferase [Terriglobales bacterium]|nr:glycine C-acetyltransferase [Terriglobales bacterium]